VVYIVEWQDLTGKSVKGSRRYLTWRAWQYSGKRQRNFDFNIMTLAWTWCVTAWNDDWVTSIWWSLVRVVGSNCYSHCRHLNLVLWRLTSKQANYGTIPIKRSCLPITASIDDAKHWILLTLFQEYAQAHTHKHTHTHTHTHTAQWHIKRCIKKEKASLINNTDNLCAWEFNLDCKEYLV